MQEQHDVPAKIFTNKKYSFLLFWLIQSTAMNNTWHEAQIKLLSIQLIIQNTQIQHTEGRDVSQISTVSKPPQQYVHLQNILVLICFFLVLKKIQSYVSKHQMNYSKTQEVTKVSKTLHTEGEERDFNNTAWLLKNNAPGYSLWHSWHWAMLSTAMGFRTANWHCLPACTWSHPWLQRISCPLSFLRLTLGNIHRCTFTNFSLLLHA